MKETTGTLDSKLSTFRASVEAKLKEDRDMKKEDRLMVLTAIDLLGFFLLDVHRIADAKDYESEILSARVREELGLSS